MSDDSKIGISTLSYFFLQLYLELVFILNCTGKNKEKVESTGINKRKKYFLQYITPAFSPMLF